MGHRATNRTVDRNKLLQSSNHRATLKPKIAAGDRLSLPYRCFLSSLSHWCHIRGVRSRFAVPARRTRLAVSHHLHSLAIVVLSRPRILDCPPTDLFFPVLYRASSSFVYHSPSELSDLYYLIRLASFCTLVCDAISLPGLDAGARRMRFQR